MSIGGFGYYGKEDGPLDTENEIIYLGPDLNISVGKFEFTGQYLYRKDTNPKFYSDEVEAETNGIVGELIFSPRLDQSRFFVTALYNLVDSDMDAYDYQTATLSGTYLIARNLRLIAEVTRDLEYEVNRGVLGLVTAF
ncbi:MAG: hypothetical protein GWN13_22260 [Phycisphaerae bacterium]|nr:hypothetical protein [Phycisphaerae bacterium]